MSLNQSPLSVQIARICPGEVFLTIKCEVFKSFWQISYVGWLCGALIIYDQTVYLLRLASLQEIS